MKFVLKNVRLSYAHIFTPSSFDDNQESAKYSATLIIPKDHPDLQELRRALFETGAEKYPQAFAGKGWPAGFTCALRDADRETNMQGELLSERNPEYKGCFILKADSIRRPLVIGRKKEALTEEDGVIYSGCYINVSLGVATYEFGKVKKGVKCYLNAVQYVAPGERFGTNDLDDFDSLDGGESDDDIDFM